MGEHTTGAVAELVGVSVRTLHHYDEIGLLRPHERNAAGYRLYSAADLERLRRILFYRSLDFDLDSIATLLDGDDDTDGLRQQRRRLSEAIARQQAMVTAIDAELDARALGVTLGSEIVRRRPRRGAAGRLVVVRPCPRPASRS